MKYTTVDSPIGELTLIGDEEGLRGLYMETRWHPPRHDPAARRDPGPFRDAIAQLGEYFAGERTDFDLRLSPAGTPFQQRVWALLREIPFGGTTTYGAMAERLGSAKVVRAVGMANGRNPISIVVPCHRVIGAGGKLVGYGGGLERKRTLLAHEAEVTAGFRETLW